MLVLQSLQVNSICTLESQTTTLTEAALKMQGAAQPTFRNVARRTPPEAMTKTQYKLQLLSELSRFRSVTCRHFHPGLHKKACRGSENELYRLAERQCIGTTTQLFKGVFFVLPCTIIADK